VAAWARENRGDLVLAGVVVAVIAAINVFLPGIDAQKALHDVSHELGAVTYALAFAAAFVETGAFVGLILPGETAVILAGAVAGQGATSIVVTIVVVWVGAFAGDTTSFWIGRRLGREFALRHGPKLRITEARLDRVEGYFERYGGRTIIVGRFIGLVRALAPFTAGTSGWRYRDYFPYGLVGTLLWAAGFSLVGYFASQHIDDAVRIAGRATLVFGLLVAGGVATYFVVRYLRRADPRVRSRLAVGGVAAVALAGLAVLVAYGVVVGGHPGPTAPDRSAFEDAADLRTSGLVDLAKVLTVLGSGWVVLPVALIVAGLLASRRRWTELVALVAAVTITFVAAGELKALIDRPRPPHPLVATVGSAYPSGHAAHAILYPSIALALVALRRPAAKAAATVVGVGLAIALVVGLTRVYLSAHYLTDVLGGWGLGAATFAGCAIAALAVNRLRQNPADDPAAG
jgi:membrane protein DedA with SNARE-associated domain/membrane-associated phospholipid phosphatase